VIREEQREKGIECKLICKIKIEVMNWHIANLAECINRRHAKHITVLNDIMFYDHYQVQHI
jgi:hypothetical protein